MINNSLAANIQFYIYQKIILNFSGEQGVGKDIF